MRTVVGQDLQRLFAAHEAGRISQAAFEQRKSALLAWSKCRWMLITPKKMRVPGELAKASSSPSMHSLDKAMTDTRVDQ